MVVGKFCAKTNPPWEAIAQSVSDSPHKSSQFLTVPHSPHSPHNSSKSSQSLTVLTIPHSLHSSSQSSQFLTVLTVPHSPHSSSQSSQFRTVFTVPHSPHSSSQSSQFLTVLTVLVLVGLHQPINGHHKDGKSIRINRHVQSHRLTVGSCVLLRPWHEVRVTRLGLFKDIRISQTSPYWTWTTQCNC